MVTIVCSCDSNGDSSGRCPGGSVAQDKVREVPSEADVISRKSSLRDVFVRARVQVYGLTCA